MEKSVDLYNFIDREVKKSIEAKVDKKFSDFNFYLLLLAIFNFFLWWMMLCYLHYKII